jgi:putative flippase GtrA
MKQTKPKVSVPEINVPTATRPWWVEAFLVFCFLALFALPAPLFYAFHVPARGVGDTFSFTYSENMSFTFSKGLAIDAAVGFLLGFVVLLVVLFLVKPSGVKPTIGKKGKWAVAFGILSIFGLLAAVVLALLLSVFKSLSGETALYGAIFLALLYEYLIYKLYFEQRTLSNHLFWEIFRFVIVGLVAAVFDFITCYLFQFVIFKSNASAWYATVVATFMGFVVGVIINYLMSTYMVYKASKSGLSKSPKGIVFFVFLAAIGLGIGIGIQYFLYNFLCVGKNVAFFSYPVDFIIRTLIVMVYNYVSRKLLIYK